MADKLDAVTGVGEPEQLAMVPLIDDSKLKTRVTALQHQVEELGDSYQALTALQASKTSALQNEIAALQKSSATRIQALEAAIEKQTTQVKTLEARLTKLESSQPPSYVMTALTKPPEKKQQ